MKTIKNRTALVVLSALLGVASLTAAAPNDAEAAAGPARVAADCPERTAAGTTPAAADHCSKVRRCTPRGCKWVWVCWGSVSAADPGEIAPPRR